MKKEWLYVIHGAGEYIHFDFIPTFGQLFGGDDTDVEVDEYHEFSVYPDDDKEMECNCEFFCKCRKIHERDIVRENEFDA
jgi:hypothetical protein